MGSAFTICCLAIALASPTLSQTVHSLSKFEWVLSNPGLNVSVPASFPSQAHLDLYKGKVIGDPYFGLNDFNLRWVAWSNWTYSTHLQDLTSDEDSTYLLFNGLDTFTSIELCGRHVASTNNQFRQYYFEVGDILRKCKQNKPKLSINFGSAPKIADRIANEPGQETWPNGVQNLYEFPNRWFIRKQQSDFGWDWGPAFAPAGPWRPAYTIQLDRKQIFPRNTLIDVYRKGQRNNRIPDQSQPWVVNASIDFLGSIPAGSKLRYVLEDSQERTVHKGYLDHIASRAGVITGDTIIQDGSVDLWWPTGLGKQTLYNLTLQIVSGGKSVAEVTKRVGFRTIVLNEEPVSNEQRKKGIAPGNNWHFEINGHEFYAKGSNFIPPDAFWPRVDAKRIRKLLETVVAANQNMLRVWSSGAYSPDFMYDIADELGVLLWSEFEFGDALYPVHQEFLDNVYEEAVYQVRRVNHHPSVAYWAGGNELENLELDLLNTSLATDPHKEKKYIYYKNQYEKLFLTTLFPAVFENSRSISYAPSSTSNGFISLNFTEAPYMEERYENTKNHSIYGETDYYNYLASLAFYIESYPVGRFSNEFGFHSMPSLQTWKQAVSPSDLRFGSSVVELRNHHYPPGGLSTHNFQATRQGMTEMKLAVRTWYPMPKKRDPVENFAALCHATQVFQGDYYASQIQFYRRGSGLPQRTLGSLYWQLEDIWQAPTWAGIEYDGRLKVMHYRAADVHKNVIASPFVENHQKKQRLTVWITSDLWEEISGTVTLSWFTWKGEPLHGIPSLDNKAVKVGALNSTRVYAEYPDEILKGHKTADVVAWISVKATGRLPNTKEKKTFSHENWWHAANLARANLVDPGLTLDYHQNSGEFVVKATKGVAASVWLDYPSGAVVEFTDNGFWLLKGMEKRVGYKVKSDTTNGKWIKGVTVQSLWDSTLP